MIFLAAAGMAVYLSVALYFDAEHIHGALLRVGLAGVIAVLGLSLLNYALRYWRWSMFIEALGYQLTPTRHLAYYLGGFAFTVSPGKAGEAVRSLYLKQHGVPYADSLAALFAERLLDAMAVTTLATLLVFSDPAQRPVVVAAGILLLTVGWLAGRPGTPALLRRLGSRSAGTPLRAAQGLARLLESATRLLQLRYLAPGFGLGVLAWMAEGYGLYLLAGYLGGGIDVSSAVGIYALAVLAGVASFFMPGGLGGMEAAMTALLVARGAGLGPAFAITVLCRLATLWFAVLLGIIALAWAEGSAREATA